jgi:palmitoyltransferase ZDHHC3/7/25
VINLPAPSLKQIMASVFNMLKFYILKLLDFITPTAVRKIKPSRKSGFGTSIENRHWLNLEVCGLITAAFVWIITLFVDYVAFVVVLYPWTGLSISFVIHFLLANGLICLALSSHLRTMLSNPGAVPNNAKPVDPAHYAFTCHKCSNFKPPRAHHCSTCGRCIIKMDHHCPWVNNCVGLANQKFFLLFVFYIMLSALYCATIIFARFINCIGSLPSSSRQIPPGLPPSVANQLGQQGAFKGTTVPALSSSPEVVGSCSVLTTASTVFMIFAILLAILFALFTGCMLVEQSTGIKTNQTQIDRMKNESRDMHHLRSQEQEKIEYWGALSEIFGGNAYRDGFQWHWLLPLPITYPNPEAVTGYCFRDVPRPRTLAEMESI